ncbi:thrombospondin type 3 repeat-containing protein [Catellatospora sp. KI3]|uniref:thrombospondin type 3 repeat-containing protein n=1 Tax=Catellatospora sp. KI3 TaxID=3041620 RepID=UPI002482AA87|nr:thrombospondin type 3 repeat-containing protein [Catellatospora sp. KI3]MDI1462941.1 thrombospondin type 3 repeat-containing protein [Catellatospora sp. KI3]
MTSPSVYRGSTFAATRRALAAAAVLALAVVATPAAAAEDPPRRPIRNLLACDTTACYAAWLVVDSDGDGYCDADEMAAGTDPDDKYSRPLLQKVVDLAVDRALPSFEAGAGAFFLLPAELVRQRQEIAHDWLGAFPLSGRADIAGKFGVTGDLMKKFGLDPTKDPFSLGLDLPGTNGGTTGGGLKLAGVKLGRTQTSMLGVDGRATYGAERGGVVDSTKDWGGLGSGDITTYGDGSETHTTSGKDGTTTVEYTNSGGSAGPTVTTTLDSHWEGDVRVDEEHETTKDADGNIIKESTTVTLNFKDGHTESQTDTVRYNLNANGQVMDTSVSHTETSSKDGKTTSSTVTYRCDANAENCTQTGSGTAEGGMYDPDYGPPVVTEEVVAGVLRTRGAAVTVLEGWQRPGSEEPELPDLGSLILVDPNADDLFVLVEPTNAARAQPESRPDLPDPMTGEPAPVGGCGGGLC